MLFLYYFHNSGAKDFHTGEWNFFDRLHRSLDDNLHRSLDDNLFTEASI